MVCHFSLNISVTFQIYVGFFVAVVMIAHLNIRKAVKMNLSILLVEGIRLCGGYHQRRVE